VAKTRMSHHEQSKTVTGLTVNRYPNVQRSFYDSTRLMVDRMCDLVS
jgi:hypothetical protein